MPCIADQLKKFAARLTTASGDVSAVPGQSICEVLDYTYKNLNVDANGNLIVSELIIPSDSLAVWKTDNWIYNDEYANKVVFDKPLLDCTGGDTIRVYYRSGSEDKQVDAVVESYSFADIGLEGEGEICRAEPFLDETNKIVLWVDTNWYHYDAEQQYVVGKGSLTLSFKGGSSSAIAPTSVDFEIYRIEKV